MGTHRSDRRAARRRLGRGHASAARALGAAVLLLAAAAPAPADPRTKFAVTGDVLRYDTDRASAASAEIAQADVAYLRKLLRAFPEIDTLVLNSGGGEYYAAMDMARIVADAGLDTVVDGDCASSCTLVFLGGAARRLRPGSTVGFHQVSWSADAIADYYAGNRGNRGWSDPFDFAAWLYRDTQDEMRRHLAFLLDRGVAPDFALETIRDQGDDLWYPDRAALRAAGVLRDAE